MSLKAELETWSKALEAYEREELERCLDLFETIADSSKILFNIGLVQATIGAHNLAVQNFKQAVNMDRYFSLAYFQSGVSHFLLGNYAMARDDFDEAYLRLRSNMTIDYEQIGLKFKLFSCEVLFNRGLSSIYMREEARGLNDLMTASKEKQTEEHSVIDEAITDRGDGYTVFSIPVGLLFRPSANKLKNLATKDYLGSAKLVAATDDRDAFTGFTGSQRANSEGGAFRDPLPEQRVGLIRSKTTVIRGETSPSSSSSRPTVQPLARPPPTLSAVRRRSSAGDLASLTLHGQSLRLSIDRTELFNNGIKDQPPTPPDSVQSRVINFNSNPSKPSFAPNVIDSYYADAYQQEDEQEYARAPTPSGQAPERTADWAQTSRKAPRPPQELSRSTSLANSSAASNYSPPRTRNQPLPHQQPEAFLRSNSTPQRFPPRPSLNTNLSAPPLACTNTQKSLYSDQGSAGYGGIVSMMTGEHEMKKIRIKLNYRNDMRGMSIPANLEREDFFEKVRMKFGVMNLSMRYRDTDNSFISIVDDDDWETAIDEARDLSQGKAEGKLEVIVNDD